MGFESILLIFLAETVARVLIRIKVGLVKLPMEKEKLDFFFPEQSFSLQRALK